MLRPREILLPRAANLFSQAADNSTTDWQRTRTLLDEWIFDADSGARSSKEQFHVLHLDGFGLDGREQAVAAAGAIVHYLRETALLGDRANAGMADATPLVAALRPAGLRLEHLDGIRFYEQQEALLLDGATVRNLELTDPLPGEDASSTLVGALDETATGMGARLLRGWILRPSVERAEIEARLDGVAALFAPRCDAKSCITNWAKYWTWNGSPAA